MALGINGTVIKHLTYNNKVLCTQGFAEDTVAWCLADPADLLICPDCQDRGNLIELAQTDLTGSDTFEQKLVKLLAHIAKDVDNMKYGHMGNK